MTIRQMELFCLVYELRNLTQAAGHLYMTQSAVTQNLQKIEEELGARLFDERGALNPAVTNEALAAYIWFKETQTPYSPPEKFSPLIGIHKGTAYYLIRGELTRQIFETLPAFDGAKIIFGDTCRMSATALQMCGATFRQLPKAIR